MFTFANKIIRGVQWRTKLLREGIFVHPDELHVLPEQVHLRQLLEHLKVDCVFDVGANAGQYATMLRKKAKFTGRIVSFEPIPKLAAEIRQAAETDPSWEMEEVALANHNGHQEMNLMVRDQFSSLGTPDHEQTSRFIGMNEPTQRILVKTETLKSAYVRLKQKYGFQRPFLKMDTQGFDVEILKSGAEMASDFVGLQSELAVKKIYRESVDFREAISYYNQLGFELSAFVPNNGGHFPELIETDCIMVRSDLMKRQECR